MTTTITRQAALNCDRFDAMPVGSGYTLYNGSVNTGYYMIDRYFKIKDGPYGEPRCMSSDGRQWYLAETAGSGANAILVPDGACSIVDFDARANGQFVRVGG